MELELDEHLKIGFYTATILDWKKLLKPDKYKEIVLDSLTFFAGEGRAKIYGFVLTPKFFKLFIPMPGFSLPRSPAAYRHCEDVFD